ncbi:MAG: ankyrin repeat protein [Alteromonas naphthalenivorans]|jgi:ankyrin repeat protein
MKRLWISVCVIVSVQAADTPPNCYDTEPDKKEEPTEQDVNKLKKYGLYQELRALLGTKKEKELAQFRVNHSLTEEKLEEFNEGVQENEFHVAAYSGDWRFLQWLFKNKKHKKIQEETATHYTPYAIALEEGYQESAKVLKPAASKSTTTKGFKSNALFWACLLLINAHLLMRS